MSLSVKNIELKAKGFLIEYNPTNLEFIPMSQVKLVRLQTRQFDNIFEVHILLNKDGIRVVHCHNEEQAKHFFHNFLNHIHQSL